MTVENLDDEVAATEATEQGEALVQRRNLVSKLLGAVGIGAAATLLTYAKRSEELIAPEPQLPPKNHQGSAGTAIYLDTIYGASASLLTTNPGGSTYEAAIVAGWMTPGDGGGGTFYWDPSSTTADDGGTIVAPTGASTGRWKRVYSGALNVAWFGAFPTNLASANNGPIQAAYTAALALSGATVYFPAGNYLISTTITIGAPRPSYAYSTINTEGDGWSTSIEWTGTTGAPAFQYLGNEGSRMSGIGFLCQTDRQSGAVALQVTGYSSSPGGTTSKGLVFERCSFGGDSNGFDWGFEAGDGYFLCSEVVFINCNFINCNSGFKGTGGGNTLNFWFYGCTFTENYVGADLSSAGNVHFWGGGSSVNTYAVIAGSGWQTNLYVSGFRCELGPAEMFVYIAPNGLLVEACAFGAATTIPTNPIIYSGYGMTCVRGCTFGYQSDTSWIPVRIGNTMLEMSNNVIGSTTPFDLAGSYTGLYYSLFGNVYNGVMHGSQVGVLVSGALVENVDTGSVSFASSGTVSVTFAAARENATYKVSLAGDAQETFWVSGKSTTGFTVNSSNATSVASVDWGVSR